MVQYFNQVKHFGFWNNRPGCQPTSFFKEPKKYALKSFELVKKELDLSDLSPKKYSESFDKIEEMADICLNSANFEKRRFSTLEPPSSGFEPKSIDQGVKS